mmetsp:Transcript_16576/g.47012  ORF Transcript_16576/g.47012 Transcript_16576/m.47012 type:complete len:377 (+) Transcript_16576:933-2063(+)
MARPGWHPRLHVRRPALHAALLLQELPLAVGLLDDAPDHDKHPHGAAREQSAAEHPPREELRIGDVLRLQRLSGRPQRLGGLHLLLQALGRILLELRGGGDQVHDALQRRRHPEFGGEPGLAGGLHVVHPPLVGPADVQEPEAPRELDQVADPREEVDEALECGRRRRDAVVQGHAQHADDRDDGLDKLHRREEVVWRSEDVNVEDAVVGAHEHPGHSPGRPHLAQLPEAVALRVQRRGGEPVVDEDHHADAGVDVVAPPFLLEATVQLEVLGDARLGPVAGMQRGLLVMVPAWDPALRRRRGRLAALLAAVGGVGGVGLHRADRGVLLRGCNERHPEHVVDALPLVRVASLTRLVQLLRGRDGQTHGAGQHVHAA